VAAAAVSSNRSQYGARDPLIDQRFLEKLERADHLLAEVVPRTRGRPQTRSRLFLDPARSFWITAIFTKADDLRAINWRAYMRLDKLFLKMFPGGAAHPSTVAD